MISDIMVTRILRMAAKHSHIAEFDGAHDDCNSYTERLDQYFVVNDVTDAGKKQAILLRSQQSTPVRSW